MRVVLRHECIAQKSVGWSFVDCHPLRCRHRKSRSLGVEIFTTGALIASYTLWDKHAVTARHIPPILMEWATGATRVILLLPLALRNWSEVLTDWNTRRWSAIWIGVLNPLAYLLVLFAMTFTPVSYIAPSREISILFGAFLGGHFLGEGDRPRRLAGAAIMLLGIVCLSVA
jgi:drug/metabolite transporter (DMT)-like permease